MTPRAPSGRSRLPDGQEQLSFDFADLLTVQDDAARSSPSRAVPSETERTPPARPPEQQHRFVAGERISAERIAELLGRDRPTAEQIAVIEAGSSPLLVVAGAGSGKTETMAARVVWLVANGLVAPEQVLGLTFTRKAAGELADRVRLRLAALRRIGFRAPGEQPGEDPQPVTVSTYHAYAASILTDHGLRLGLETGNRLLGEAGAWQIVDELVERWDGDMTGVDAARSTVVDAVLSLAGECAEHLVDHPRHRRRARGGARPGGRPAGEDHRGGARQAGGAGACRAGEAGRAPADPAHRRGVSAAQARARGARLR